jgi:hypothetical protein
MIDPQVKQKADLLKEKILEINLLLEELHSDDVLVNLSSGRFGVSGPTVINIVSCTQHVDYLGKN